VIYQNDLLPGHGSYHFRLGKTKFVQNKSRLRGDVPLGNGLGFNAAFGHQIRNRDSGNDAVGIRVFVAYDKCCHGIPPKLICTAADAAKSLLPELFRLCAEYHKVPALPSPHFYVSVAHDMTDEEPEKEAPYASDGADSWGGYHAIFEGRATLPTRRIEL
jgi:hypothetical protein